MGDTAAGFGVGVPAPATHISARLTWGPRECWGYFAPPYQKWAVPLASAVLMFLYTCANRLYCSPTIHTLFPEPTDCYNIFGLASVVESLLLTQLLLDVALDPGALSIVCNERKKKDISSARIASRASKLTGVCKIG